MIGKNKIKFLKKWRTKQGYVERKTYNLIDNRIEH